MKLKNNSENAWNCEFFFVSCASKLKVILMKVNNFKKILKKTWNSHNFFVTSVSKLMMIVMYINNFKKSVKRLGYMEKIS